LVIFLHLNTNNNISTDALSLIKKLHSNGASTTLLSIGSQKFNTDTSILQVTLYYYLSVKITKDNIFSFYINIPLTNVHICPNLPCLAEISLKWVLNAITTGAHVLKGKVFKNSMIDVSVSNNKLFYRSVNIVAKITSVNPSKAEELIIKSIWETDTLTSELSQLPVSQHIQKAFSRPNPKIVPIAILMAFNESYLNAKERINKEPIIRKIINEFLQ
jgi:hypothetical protein